MYLSKDPCSQVLYELMFQCYIQGQAIWNILQFYVSKACVTMPLSQFSPGVGAFGEPVLADRSYSRWL